MRKLPLFFFFSIRLEWILHAQVVTPYLFQTVTQSILSESIL